MENQRPFSPPRSPQPTALRSCSWKPTASSAARVATLPSMAATCRSVLPRWRHRRRGKKRKKKGDQWRVRKPRLPQLPVRCCVKCQARCAEDRQQDTAKAERGAAAGVSGRTADAAQRVGRRKRKKHKPQEKTPRRNSARLTPKAPSPPSPPAAHWAPRQQMMHSCARASAGGGARRTHQPQILLTRKKFSLLFPLLVSAHSLWLFAPRFASSYRRAVGKELSGISGQQQHQRLQLVEADAVLGLLPGRVGLFCIGRLQQGLQVRPQLQRVGIAAHQLPQPRDEAVAVDGVGQP